MPISKHNILDTIRIVNLSLSVGEMKDFQTISICSVPSADLPKKHKYERIFRREA
jgi:hypothetical protein